MIVFKTFWKIIKKYKGTIIGFTIMLLVFGTINSKSKDTSTSFNETTPDIAVIDKDKTDFSKNLVKYLSTIANIKDIKESDIDDAIFYRDISYYICIPKNFEENILRYKDEPVIIKTNETQGSFIVQTYLNRYLNVLKIRTFFSDDKKEIVRTVDKIMNSEAQIHVNSTFDSNQYSGLNRYYNFASYTLISVIMFIICIVLSSFHKKSITKRINVSSMDYKNHNRYIIYASIIYTIIVVLFYALLGLFTFGTITISKRGLLLILNTLVFSVSCLSLSILVSSLTNNKGALNGMINVIGLSQAFLCGAFIPSMYLPSKVVSISKIFPAYYYINNNDYISTTEVFSINPFLKNIIILIIFSILFLILNNIVTKKKRVSYE